MTDVRATALQAEVAALAPDDPPAHVTALSGEVAALFVGNMATVTSLQGEVASLFVPADTVDVTEVHAYALVEAEPDTEIGVRMSQLAAEALLQSEDSLDLSQLVAEVLLKPEFNPCTTGPLIGCTTTPVAYRLRIRNADDDADELYVTSLGAGEDAVIAAVPVIDGATFDPLTGKTTIGGANIQVIDAASGQPGFAFDPTDRVVTKILADATGRSQLLGRKAFIELSADCEDAEFRPHFAGYVTSLKLIDAITWEIGLAHTSRDDARSKIWARSDDPTLSARSVLLGGPVTVPVPYDTDRSRMSTQEGYWQAEVIGVYDTFIHLDIDEDTSAAFPPADLVGELADKGLIHFTDNDAQKNVFRWAQGVLQKYFVRSFPSPTAQTEWEANPAHAGAIRGYAPRVVVNVVAVNGGAVSVQVNPMCSYARTYIGAHPNETLAWEDLGNHFYIAWGNDNPTPQPSPGDILTFNARPLDVSPAAPVWVFGKPAEIIESILVARGYTVDASSVSDTNDDVGDYLVTLRITQPKTVAETLQVLCGLFGIGIRVDPDGERVLFCWRVRHTPVATITLADLAERAPSLWETEEQSKLFAVKWSFSRFDRWPGVNQTVSTDRALDGIVAFDEAPITFQTDADELIDARTQEYSIAGALLIGSGGDEGDPVPSLADAVAPWAQQTLAMFGDGAIMTTLNVLPSVGADIGDEVIVDLPPRPGFDKFGTPVGQRGINERCLVVGRTPHSWGDAITLLRIPPDEE